MSLPKIDVPVYDLELPLSKKKLKFRPFLVKEQKNLLMALEANDAETINNNIRQILLNCTVSDINIDDLPILDVEYYFINLRARSVSEVVESRYRCNNIVDGLPDETGVPTTQKECGNIMESSMNILDIKLEKPNEVSDIIKLTDTIALKMKYAPFSSIKKASVATSSADLAFEMILDSIEAVYDGEQVYYTKETTRQELQEFVESLNQRQFEQIQNFFEKTPTLTKKVEIKCSKCGFEHSIQYEGIESFFD